MPLGFTRLQALTYRPQLKTPPETHENQLPNLQLTHAADAVRFSGERANASDTPERMSNLGQGFRRLLHALWVPIRWPLSKLGILPPRKPLPAPTPIHARNSQSNPFAAQALEQTPRSQQLQVPQTTPAEATARPEQPNKPNPVPTKADEFPRAAVKPFTPPPGRRMLYPGIREVRNKPQLFWNAVMAGKVDVARQLIAEGMDANIAQVNGATPLHDAAARGNLPMVQVLLAAPKINVNAEDNWGTRPIHKAVIENHPDVVDALVRRGAQLEADSWYENKPLQLAANLGYEEVANLLIAHGAKVNGQSWQGYTPLYWAAEHGHLPIVRELLAHDADVTIPNRYGETPLHGAARGGRRDVMALLLRAKGADANVPDNHGETPLHRAASRDHLGMLEMLKSNGGDLHLKSNHGETPLDIVNKRKPIRAAKAEGRL